MLFKSSISLLILGGREQAVLPILSVTERSMLKLSAGQSFFWPWQASLLGTNPSSKDKMRSPGGLPVHTFEYQSPPTSRVG